MTDTDDCFLMGRILAKAMGYVSYPEILPPIRMKQNFQINIKTAQAEKSYPEPDFRIFEACKPDKRQSKLKLRKFENTKSISTMQKSVQTPQQPQQVQGKLFKET